MAIYHYLWAITGSLFLWIYTIWTENDQSQRTCLMAFTRNVKYDGSRRYYRTNPHISNIDVQTFILSIMPLVVAAFAYPLGNRKMMALVDNDLNTIERIYGMTLVTLLFGLLSFLLAYLHKVYHLQIKWYKLFSSLYSQAL